MKYIGGILVIIGDLLFLIAYIKLNSLKNSVNKFDSAKLITTGIYAISRNPIYLALHTITIGFTLIIPTWITFVCIVIFIINFHLRIKLEEKELEETFGKDYIEYKKKVLKYIGRRIKN
ncbi:MAG: isoprenylcysteine carboxylmethyltransferase family protein [Candidatus Lokiarchaeota archaeon]|nr:isoprenylcysteine carboxylmethyltransferase family protein [Candidatus Lokiarchaeota archaeon]